MLSALSAAAVSAAPLTAHYGPGGFGWLWLFVPLFWIAIFFLIFGLFGRRWRRGGPPWQHGPSPEQSLGERFAQGDIDEQEYRTRLEVLRANQPKR
jgi:putative membrane protein